MIRFTHNIPIVRRRLNKVPREFDSALKRALTKASLYVERRAKMRSPVDTGRMRASINTEIHQFTATVQPHVNYAVYVHDGTRYMRARPFMKKGLEDSISDIRTVFDRELGNILK